MRAVLKGLKAGVVSVVNGLHTPFTLPSLPFSLPNYPTVVYNLWHQTYIFLIVNSFLTIFTTNILSWCCMMFDVWHVYVLTINCSGNLQTLTFNLNLKTSLPRGSAPKPRPITIHLSKPQMTLDVAEIFNKLT